MTTTAHRASPRTVRAPRLRATVVGLVAVVVTPLVAFGAVPWWLLAATSLGAGSSTLEWWFRRSTTLTLDRADARLTISHPYRTVTLPVEGTTVRARRLGAGEWLWWFRAADGTRVWLPTWDQHDELAVSLRSVGVTVTGR